MRHSHHLLFVGIDLLIIVLAAACTPGPAGDLPVTREGPEATGTPEPSHATTTPEPYPPPTQTLDPGWQLTIAAQMTESAPQPTETPAPPPPTARPTPVVTPIPTAAPPIITSLEGVAPRPFTIVYRQGNEVRVVASDGSNERVLIDVHAKTGQYLAPESMGIVNWGAASPDGSQLALALSTSMEPTDGAAKFSIHLFSMLTGELRLLVEDGLDPTWSPDGAQIAYGSTQTQGLWVVNVTTGQAREIYAVAGGRSVAQMSWAPDSQRLVFVDQLTYVSSDIVVADVSQPEATKAILSPPQAYSVWYPQWSPDGSQILFISPETEEDGLSHFDNVWVMKPDGENRIQLTRDMSVAGGSPGWSPDGSWIAFTAVPVYDPQPDYELWLIDATGQSLKRVTADVPGAVHEGLPAWSPDGAQVILARNRSEVWLVSLVDGGQTRLSVPSIDVLVLPWTSQTRSEGQA